MAEEGRLLARLQFCHHETIWEDPIHKGQDKDHKFQWLSQHPELDLALSKGLNVMNTFLFAVSPLLLLAVLVLLPHSSVPIWISNPFPPVTAHLSLAVFPCSTPVSFCFHFL